VYQNACELKRLCYNAETTSNKLPRKGLSVFLNRSIKAVRLLCFVMAAVALGLPAEALAAVAQKSAAPAKSATTKSTTTKSSTTKSSTTPSAAKKKTTTKKASSTTARARRLRASRARAAAAAKALAEAQEPRFKTDENGVEVPDVRAEAAIIYNPGTGEVLWESNSQTQRSIASITKVMTALVFVEGAPDLDKKVVITRDDMRAASTTHLRAGYTVTQGDLLHLTLIASDNAAARALARVSPQGTAGFISRMNAKAAELGLKSTSYSDTSGLLATNVSSAYDMAKLITLVSTDERISSVMRKDHYSFPVGRRTVNVTSTNQLLTRGNVDGDVQAAKTGFITKAGYCLATLLQLPQGGPQVAVVVLGAKSNAGRFWETRHLFNWVSGRASELLGAPNGAVAIAQPAIE
jgi:serine-type D-Ala-D-Ala endopeptidase (penicillin-binding protein 7)